MRVVPPNCSSTTLQGCPWPVFLAPWLCWQNPTHFYKFALVVHQFSSPSLFSFFIAHFYHLYVYHPFSLVGPFSPLPIVLIPPQLAP